MAMALCKHDDHAPKDRGVTMGSRLCGSPASIGDWAEIKDWHKFEVDCRKNKDMMGSAVLFSCMSWMAHKAVMAAEKKPVNTLYAESYERIRVLAMEVIGEREIRKIEIGVQNVIEPK
jgi:hypothetical protein